MDLSLSSLVFAKFLESVSLCLSLNLELLVVICFCFLFLRQSLALLPKLSAVVPSGLSATSTSQGLGDFPASAV